MKRTIICLIGSLAMLSSQAQGIIICKKNGTQTYVPYEEIDSIITTPTERKTFTVNGVTFGMNRVKAGTFSMGAGEGTTQADKDEMPQHQVTLTQDYYIGETEVTQALWKAVTGQSPTEYGQQWSSKYGKGDNYPAYFVSYNDAKSFLGKLNKLTGEKFRLPTEAEWEFAAKGGNLSQGYLFSGSNDINLVAWYSDNSDSKAHEVKTKAPNELGLYDMSGNVWEWCSDWYGTYDASDATDPQGPERGSGRAYRGGSWYYGSKYERVTARDMDIPAGNDFFLGMRLTLTAAE